MTKGLYGLKESGLIVPQEHAEVRVASPKADIVLDPVCGSGTTAVSASQLNRRFICIDKSQDAVDITWSRLSLHVRNRTVRSNFFLDKYHFEKDPMLWDCGYNFLVCGDAIEVLRSMPESFVALVYADPPFNAGKNFVDKKTGVGFSDIWHWDDDAKARLKELKRMPADRFDSGKSGKIAMLMGIQAAKIGHSKAMASYLTWCALLLIECRRVMGSYEYEETQNRILHC